MIGKFENVKNSIDWIKISFDFKMLTIVMNIEGINHVYRVMLDEDFLRNTIKLLDKIVEKDYLVNLK